MKNRRSDKETKDKTAEQVLMEMLQNLTEERADMKIRYSDNENRIFQNGRYIDTVEENGETEFQVFSPRHIVASYKEKTDNIREETRVMQEENEELRDRIQELNKKITEIHEALDSCRESGIIEDESDGGYEDYSDFSGDEESGWDGVEEDKDESFEEYDEYETDKRLLDIMDIEECEKKNILRDIRENSIQNLYHLIAKLENCSRFATSDPVRTKLDLDVIIGSLGEIINRLEFSVSDMQPVSIQEKSFGEKFERLVLYFVQLFPDVHINYDVMKEVDMEEMNCFLVLKIIKNAIRFYIDYYGCGDVYVLCETKYEEEAGDEGYSSMDYEEEDEEYPSIDYEKEDEEYSSIDYEKEDEDIEDGEDGEDDYEKEDGECDYEGAEYLDILIGDHEIEMDQIDKYQVIDFQDYEFDFTIMQRRVEIVEGVIGMYSMDEYHNVIHITVPL